MDFLIYIGKAAIVLSLFQIVYVALLKSDTHFTTNRLFLLSGLLLSFVFPFIQFTKTVTIPAPKTNLAGYSEEIPAYLATASQQIDWWGIALIAYILVTTLFLIRFGKQCYSLYLLLQKHPTTTKGEYKYILTEERVLPFSFFNYIIYNPALHHADELSMILKHEEVHAHQKHSIDIVIANLLTAIQWANPLAWLYKKSIEENLEFIADNETATQVSSKKEYQVALVRASSTYPIPALTTNFYQSFIKKRIVMLNKNNSKKVNNLKSIAIVPLLALFLWGFNVNETVQYAEVENSPADPVIQKIEKNVSKIQNNNTVASALNSEAISSEEKKTKTSSSSEKRYGAVLQDSVKPIKIIITKNTSDAELEAYKQKLKAEDKASFNYKNVKRNTKGEITGISIAFSDSRGNNNNYSVSSDQPISDYLLTVSENGAISSRTVLTEEQKMQRQKMMAQRDEMISERNEEMEQMKKRMQERRKEIEVRQKERMEEQEERMKERNQSMKKRLKVVRERTGDSSRLAYRSKNPSNERIEIISTGTNNQADNPIYYVDGKETKEAKVKKITPESIEKINILKGKKALKKYGGKGINGVVEITTKQ